MRNEEDLIEYISRKFDIFPQEDGSFVVKDGQNIYKISKLDDFNDQSKIFSSSPVSNTQDNRFLHPRVGQDDKEPDFDSRIKPKKPNGGMFPDFDNKQKPLFQYDPTHPGKKNKKNWPEPDPDNFEPGKKLHEYDNL